MSVLDIYRVPMSIYVYGGISSAFSVLFFRFCMQVGAGWHARVAERKQIEQDRDGLTIYDGKSFWWNLGTYFCAFWHSRVPRSKLPGAKLECKAHAKNPPSNIT
eukprot:GEMP01130206.1.p1 GENE.GEMP01130206.1~~GEMP01130206.1.p1  ORF type:complete len:104 (+),score=12.09 GEMP01130206.1:102-413(+)